jgi:hypothetical protein
MWTLWRRCYGCFCIDQLRRCGGCCRDDHEEETIVGPLLLLFFHCSTYLVVTIYDLLLVSILRWHGRSSASVAYPYPYSYSTSYTKRKVYDYQISRDIFVWTKLFIIHKIISVIKTEMVSFIWILYTYISMTYYNSFMSILLKMHIGHINTQSEHVTSAPNVTSSLNQYNRGLIGKFTPKSLSFNLSHNQHP